MIRNSYCTGSAGIEAAEAAADLMKVNMARKEASEGQCRCLSVLCYWNYDVVIEALTLGCYAEEPEQNEEKNLAAWGTDVPEDLVLDQKRLAEALKKVNNNNLIIFSVFWVSMIEL